MPVPVNRNNIFGTGQTQKGKKERTSEDMRAYLNENVPHQLFFGPQHKKQKMRKNWVKMTVIDLKRVSTAHLYL